MNLRDSAHRLLRSTERFTKTDMVYLVRNSFWVNANFVTVSVLALLLSVAFANLLPKEVYGTYQYLFSIYAVLTGLTLTGMNASVTQAVARGFEGTFLRSIRPQIMWNLIPALIACVMAGYYILINETTIALGLVCVAIALPLYNAFNSYSAYLAGKEDFRRVYLYATMVNLPYYLAMFIGTYLLRDALALVVINLFVNTALVGYTYLRIQRMIPKDAPTDETAIKYGQRLTFLNLPSTIATQVDSLLVFHVYGPASLASYALIKMAPERISGIFKSILAPAFPRFANRSQEEVRAQIVSKAIYLGLTALVVAGAYALLAPWLFSIIYPAYVDDAGYSQVYGFIMLAAVSNLGTTVLQAQRREKHLLLFSTIMPLLQISSQVIGIITGGLWGLIAAKLVITIMSAAFAITLVARDST